MKRYPHYKPSGIKWIGDVPEHWGITRAKHILIKLNRSATPDMPVLICSNHGNVVFRGDKRIGLISETEHDYQGVIPGDLLIHGMDTWHGAIAISQISGKCTSVVHVCDSIQNKRFVMYYLQGLAIKKVFKAITNGVRQNTSDFRSWNEAGKIPVVVPSDDEQREIVAFLDRMTAKIDGYIAAKEAEIEKLGTLKQAVISRAVTRGLDPNAPMKDSKIPWIGDVPEHWKRIRFKDVLAPKDIRVGNNPQYTLLSLTKQGVIIRDLSEGKGKFPKDFDTYKVVEPDDLILCLFDVDETPRTVGVAQDHGMITGAYDIFKVKRCHLKYLYYLYLSFDDKKSLRPLYKGLRKTIPLPRLLSSHIFLPGDTEQQAIVDFIDRKIREVNEYIGKIREQIGKLKIYKQRLIADAVTGKIDVRAVTKKEIH